MAGWPAGPGSHALLVALTAQTHSPGPCSHVLLVALATQTHSPVTRWLAQWLSDCVSLAFQLRRHFAAPAFSAFVSTGWLAGRLALVHMLCLWLYYLNPLSIPLFTCSACGPHSSNPYPGAPNHPHCTTHPATLHHPTHPHTHTHTLSLSLSRLPVCARQRRATCWLIAAQLLLTTAAGRPWTRVVAVLA